MVRILSSSGHRRTHTPLRVVQWKDRKSSRKKLKLHHILNTVDDGIGRVMARSALPRAHPMSHPRKRVDGGDLYLQRDDRPRRFGAACSFMNACQCTRKCTHTERLTSVHILGAVMMMMMIVMMCTNGAYGQQHGSQKDLASLQSQHSVSTPTNTRGFLFFQDGCGCDECGAWSSHIDLSINSFAHPQAPSTSEPRVEAAPALLSVYACPMNWSSAAVVATAAGEAEMSARQCEFVHFAGVSERGPSVLPIPWQPHT